jgi:hypothetical protein
LNLYGLKGWTMSLHRPLSLKAKTSGKHRLPALTNLNRRLQRSLCGV